MLKELFNEKAVILDLNATTKEDALIEIAAHLEKNEFILNKDDYLNALKARESQSSTGIGEEIAIPHAQNATVQKNVVLIARAKNGIKWDSLDGKDAKYIFSIALNDKDMDKQVEVLKNLSTALINPESKVNLEKASSVNELMESLVTNKIDKVKDVNAKKIIAVTACPTGIAHTFMAADNLNQAAAELGYNVKTETQGRRIENKLTDADIANADAIILAIDKGIEGMGRFNGKKVLKVSTRDAIKDSKSLISRALTGEGEVIKAAGGSSASEPAGDYSWGAFKNVYKNLMGGVSKMLPFVVAGGIMLGIAFLLDSGNSGGDLGATRDIAAWFAGLGKVAFGIFVPVLGAYVAYSIVGSEGLMPGLVAGIIASGGGILYEAGADPNTWANMWGRLTPGIDQGVLASGSGFLGAMVGGYVAAASIVIIRRYIFVNPGPAFRGVVDIVGLPVFSILITGLGMFIFQMPLAYVAYGLQRLLIVFQDNNLVILLTMILGIMMAVDMGGPVNKVAYVFATASLGEGTEVHYQIMAAVMAAGMVPPLAIAFSALIFKDKAYSLSERESAKANWLLGAFFITEGAIPFAAKDPKRVLPSMMVASGLTGLLIGLFQVGVNAPHGGIITIALFRSYLFSGNGAQIGMGIVFLLASLSAGMVAGGFLLGFWKANAVKSGKLNIA